MNQSTLSVIAKRWRRGWELHIDGYGVTQSRTLDQESVVREVRDYVTLETGVPCTADMNLAIDLGGYEAQVKAAQEATELAALATQRAATQAREVAVELRSMGLSVTDSAAVMGVSRGRISQLVR
ncbi:hypothetical protein SAMN05421595_1378 [Austwickia chelonae]|uniref:Antitoxin HicB n=1 Tax=Austwickia chelonae NBRC 105200 TaxID=1184607 RepID=K6ULT9_9MICO|nr:hypothetical protein [Austwickia chelonae]GAB77541.1 hypothetical protein AUCHE_05_04530 [Austwickia chelonae NBRC 105200]SEW12500.1 hypothetical protein SAMN05421595_1378 [Austwickia chelonae]